MKFSFGGNKAERPVPRRRLDAQRQARNETLESTTPAMSFRRNQTLTGSRSSEVRSASEFSTQAALRSPRTTSHHLRAHRRKLSTYLMALVFISALTYGLLHQITDRVTVALYGQVAPLPAEDQQRLVGVVHAYLDAHPAERLRFLLNTERLAAYMFNQDVREVSSVTRVDADGIGGTRLELKVREPIASWTIGSDRRYVDGSGVIFSQNYFDTPSVRIRDESGLSIRGESQAVAVTSSRFLQFIGQAVNALEQEGISVSLVSIPANKTRQVDLMIDGKRVMMTVDRPVGEQSEDAARAVRYLASKNQSLRYIDVRVGGRAYYR